MKNLAEINLFKEIHCDAVILFLSSEWYFTYRLLAIWYTTYNTALGV